MIKIPMDIYTKTLAGYINDEDKLVTYKWLSNELEIHVNVAKQVLEEYWSKHKDEEIVATIMLIGYLKGGEMRVELVKESDLAVATEKYDKIISQHIYSLQKTLPDIEHLAGAGKGDTKYGAIYCKKSVLLTDEELFARRWGAATIFNAPQEHRKPPIDKAVDTKKSNGIGKFLKEPGELKKHPDESAKNQQDKSDEKKISPSKNKTSPKTGTIAKKIVQSQKTGFTNLFGKVSAANQKRSPPSTVDSKDAKKVESDPIKENVNNTNNSDEKSAPEQKIKFKTEDKSPSDESLEIIEDLTSVEKKSVKIVKSQLKSNKNKKTNRGTKRERSQDSKSDSKKRKRIVVVSDSSEESAASDNEMICDSPPREEIVEKQKPQSPPLSQTINGKRKIRKTVDKTFMDDDGYLVTRKEQVYESCSEEEEPVKVLEPKKIAEPPAKMIKKQNKQTSLMNFFKKV